MQGICHNRTYILLLLLLGIITLGCDRPPPLNPEVPTERRILGVVEDVDDFAQTPRELKRVAALFAPGSEPSKESLARYANYHYEGKLPVISGDSATVTVVIKDLKSGNPVDEVQWSMVKSDKGWRLKEAPLPADTGNKR
jgi:hypothetical protein